MTGDAGGGGWIDVHCHYADPGFPEAARRETGADTPVVTTDGPADVLVRHDRTIQFVKGELSHLMSLDHRLATMDANGTRIQVISPPSFFYHYHVPGDVGARVCAILNDGVFAAVESHPDRFLAMPAVPLQDCELAIAELERVSRIPYVAAITIGSNVNGTDLDEPRLLPFFAAAESMQMPIFIHPASSDVAGGARMKDYFLRNMVGNPLDTTLVAARLMFSGILDRHPSLRFCLSHGGGYLTYAVGRFRRGFTSHTETHTSGASDPGDLIKRFYADGIVHSRECLRFAISQFGANRLVCGSDYPFEIGEPNPRSRVEELEIGPSMEQQILWDNAAAFLRPEAFRAIPHATAAPHERGRDANA
jgi:aminocarboxymuconate-semialdehyde decarboxylase